MTRSGSIDVWSSVFLWMSGAGWLAVAILLILAGAGVAGLLAYSHFRRKPRIKIWPKERVIITAAGVEINCPACRTKLEDGLPRVSCQIDPRHQIHARCREIVTKCPRCNGKLI